MNPLIKEILEIQLEDKKRRLAQARLCVKMSQTSLEETIAKRSELEKEVAIIEAELAK